MRIVNFKLSTVNSYKSMTTEQLLQQIRDTIYANGAGAITGPVMQGVLLAMAGAAGPVDVGDFSSEQSLDAALSEAAFANTVGGIPRGAVLRGSYLTGGNRVAVLVVQAASGSQCSQLRLYPSSGGASWEVRWCALPATASSAEWSEWEALGGGGGGDEPAYVSLTDLNFVAEGDRVRLDLTYYGGTGKSIYLLPATSSDAGLMTPTERAKLVRAVDFWGNAYSGWDAVLEGLKLAVPTAPAFWVQVGSYSYLVERCTVGSGLTAYHYFYVMDTFASLRYAYYRDRTDGGRTWSGWQTVSLTPPSAPSFVAVDTGADDEYVWASFFDNVEKEGLAVGIARFEAPTAERSGIMTPALYQLLTGLDPRVSQLEQQASGAPRFAVVRASAYDTGRTVDRIYTAWDSSVLIEDARVEWQKQMDTTGGDAYATGRFWLVATDVASGTQTVAFAAWPELSGIHASTCYNQSDDVTAAARTDVLYKVGEQTFWRDGFSDELSVL